MNMTEIIEITLGVLVLFTSTCFGFSVGKNAGFKEGMEFCAKLMNNMTFKIEDSEEDEK